jgi:hypothetical protein
MTTNNKVIFKGVECTISYLKYENGRTGLQLWDAEGPYARATINVPEVTLAVNEVIIKDYAENSGMYLALLTAGIITPTDKTINLGYVFAPIARLKNTPPEEGEKHNG